MILRGIQVENWRNISRLNLNDLPDGIVVLHGPNRTGKSSLMLALRCCLFDADHDSSSKEVKNSISWDGAGPPKVAIEFCTAGTTYRLTKVFSKKKEGSALLEERRGPDWIRVEGAPKEASRRVRELLGADKSIAGLNQLLWLAQGEVGLPEAKNLDNTLATRLVEVLGVMVTGQDLHFKQTLDERWARWFTPLGRQKENSPVSRLEEMVKKRLQTLQEENSRLKKWESSLSRMQSYEEELPNRQRDVDQSTKEIQELKQEWERCQERLRRNSEATNELKACGTRRQQAEAMIKALVAGQKRRAEAARAVELVTAEAQAAQDRRQAAQQAHEKEERLLENSRQTEEHHRLNRDEIDDRRKLLMLVQQHGQLQRQRDSIAQYEKEIAELETYLATEVAPDEKQLAALRDNRRQAGTLHAKLKTDELTLAITLHEPVSLEITLDGQNAGPVTPAPGATVLWHLRQRAEITMAALGKIEVARAVENLDLNRVARDLADRDRDFDATVRSFREDPADETCLDRLAEKRLQRNARAERLRSVQMELARTAPDGRAAIDARDQAVAFQRQAILERRLNLTDWQPDAAQIDALENAFRARATELTSLCQQQEVATRASSGLLRQAEENWQAHQKKLAGALSFESASCHELERLGNEAELQECLAQAQKAEAAASERLAEHALTEVEKSIDRRLAEGEAAQKERQRRLRELEKEIDGLAGELRGNEGLHLNLADAEAAYQEAETALAREKLDAEAHNYLRALFEARKENQVQQVMGPVASRVLDWSRKIGLNEYQEVRFGDGFMPEGIVMDKGNREQAPAGIADESYGTGEQLSLLVRLALGGILAKAEPVVAILDDPLAHADAGKHRNLLNVLRLAADGGPGWTPPAGPLQILILTCHPERFDHLPGATHIDLAKAIRRS